MSKKDIWDREQDVNPTELKKRTVRSFILFFSLLATGVAGFYTIYRQPQSAENLQPFLRANLENNEYLLSNFFRAGRPTKTYKKSEVVKARVNGDVGMGGTLDPAAWRLKVARAPGDTLTLTLNDIKALPKTEVIFDFKCVEGWSQVTHWGGVRFSDFLKKYGLAAQSGQKYVGMITPDTTYYVGVDMPSMLQPQTLLCYEMNGLPLPQNQGAPLRLIIPVKYGIKHLKRIGTIYFNNTKPKDYWNEQGYDYYAGL